MSRFSQNAGYSRKQLVGLGLAGLFAVVAGVGVAIHRERLDVEGWFLSPEAKLKRDYDRDVVPAMRDLALNLCGNKDAATHGTLAAKFIFDSNVHDDVRAALKAKRVDPRHFSDSENPEGEGYLSVVEAHKLTRYLLDKNIVTMAEPDLYEGQIQADYMYNGTGGGILTFYYDEPRPGTTGDSIKVPMSKAVQEFLQNMMAGQYTEIGRYQVVKAPETTEGWKIKVTPIVMDGPAAPVRLRPPEPVR